MPVIGAVRLKVERGGEYVARLPVAAVDRVLLQATREASGLDPRSAASLRIIVYRRGPDLRLTVFQSDTDRPASPVDFHDLGQKLQARLAGELLQAADRLRPLAREADSELGRVELLTPQVPSRTMPEPPRAVPAEAVPRPPIVVEFRLVRCAFELSRLAPKRQAEILDRAALRAFPFLTGDGQREIQASSEGRSLRVRIALPPDGGWRREELQHGAFEARFVNEVSRQLSLEAAPHHEREALEPSLSPAHSRSTESLETASSLIPTNGAARRSERHREDQKFARLVCAKVLSGEADRDPKGFAQWIHAGLRSYRSRAPFGQALREGLREMRGGLETPLTDIWARLRRAVPPPMRAAYVLTKTIGRIIPRE